MMDNALPANAWRETFLKTVKESQVSIVIGETGSGKSTQLLQYLYQDGFAERGLIACTQPRKIAATSLATHVSSEMASRVGQEVGYHVGMQSKKTAITKSLFMTDHILLNECLRDNNLSAFSCIIIDEAHERSIFTDLLIGMLKECMENRPELRVVITSATIDPDVFVSYFGGPHVCPVIRVSRGTFPVDVIWENDMLDSAFPDCYETKALKAAVKIHTTTEVAQGDILVFLTSQVEIERCCEKFQKQFVHNSTCLPLHGKLNVEERQLMFVPNAPYKRKVVFANHSAETSISIPGIKFVVDTGVLKEMRYDPNMNINSFDVRPVSQSSANQRKGLAGRTASGKCFRLYTESDFNKMKKTGSPEIMRVHLGQALLKLKELNVNPRTFDFVQKPSPEAMDTAFQTLTEIGAVSATCKLTELGQWISKLPVDPRLGAMIKHGVNADVAVEVLVIAASFSQGEIFYRVGTTEEKKDADLMKMRFCHEYGDLLTILNVYREWDSIHENNKGLWCKNNYINGTSVKGIHETVKEMLTILQKEERSLKYELKKDSLEVDAIVQTVLFRSYMSNISYYLGHEKAGYMTAKKRQHVQIHPSSCLPKLALQPTWVIFIQLLKTTDTFITGITPVSQEAIENALKEKLIDIDIDDLKKRKVERVLQVPVGKHVFWKFVGPMHQNRREIERNIQAICNETVIDADKKRGEISLYCVEENKEDVSEMLYDAIMPLCEIILHETKNEPIGHDQCKVSVLLGQGCGVIDVLMPNQFCNMNIKVKNDVPGTRSHEFTIRLKWCRRLAKGACYVTLQNKDDLKLIGTEFDIGSKGRYTIMRSMELSDLYITNLNPYVTEQEVTAALARVLRVELEEGSTRFTVIIPRVDAPHSSNEMQRVTEELSLQMLTFDESNSFKVTVLKYKEKAAFCTAFVTFQDAQIYESVVPKLKQTNIVMGGKEVKATMEFEASVFISKRIYDVTKEDIDMFIKNINQIQLTSKLQLQTLKNGNIVANLRSCSIPDLAKIRMELDVIIEGDTLENGGNIKNIKVLFTSSAKQKILQFEEKTNTIIVVNDRTMKITIQGLKTNRLHAIEYIEDYIAETGSAVERRIDLKGVEHPPGLMKAVLTAYGLNLGKLQSMFNLLSADLHLQNHVITILGERDDVDKTEKAILNVRENLCKSKKVEIDAPDCPVCLCPVEFSDHQRLEYCGHAYCQICLISMIEDAIKSRQFPLQCLADGCEKLLVIRDIYTQLNIGKIQKKDYVDSALSNFVAKNSKDYKFCITPDCSMIYKVSTDGMAFHCFLCQTDICTTCHIPFHNGLTCEMYQRAKKANSEQNPLKAWLEEKPDIRKLCPKCGLGIEKTGGCDHITCAACKAHICWKCLAYFDNRKSCGDHMSADHGGFF